MKILCIVLFHILLVASTVFAGFTLRTGVYRMSELDIARVEAAIERKAVAFLYSDEKTFCTQCVSASLRAMETLAGDCVLVYVDKSDAASLPLKVKNALRSPEAGKYIPAVVVMSHDLENVIAIIPYAKGDGYRKLLSEAKKKILLYGK